MVFSLVGDDEHAVQQVPDDDVWQSILSAALNPYRGSDGELVPPVDAEQSYEHDDIPANGWWLADESGLSAPQWGGPMPPRPLPPPVSPSPPPGPQADGDDAKGLINGLIGAYDLSEDIGIHAHVEQVLSLAGVQLLTVPAGEHWTPDRYNAVETKPTDDPACTMLWKGLSVPAGNGATSSSEVPR